MRNQLTQFLGHCHLRSCIAFTYYVFVFVLVLFPTARIYQFNVKQALLVIIILLILIYFFTGRYLQNSSVLKTVIYLLFLLSFLLLWFDIALLRDDLDLISTFSAVQVFFVTFFVVLLSYFLYEQRIICFNKFFIIIIISNFTYLVLKLGITFLIFWSLLDISTALYVLNDIFHADFASQLILPGLVRMQILNDTLTPFVLSYAMIDKELGLKLGSKFKALYIILGALSIFLTFSRLIWGIFAVAVVSFIILFKGKRAVTVWILAIGILFFYLVASGMAQKDNFLSEMVEKRFFSSETAESDYIRTEQKQILTKEISENILLGKGIGGYVRDYTRNEVAPYSYEMQWLSFVLQFGLIGIIVLFLNVSFIAFYFFKIKGGIKKIRLYLLVMYFLWVSSGLTNPYLISSISGLLFSMFLLAGIQINEKFQGN